MGLNQHPAKIVPSDTWDHFGACVGVNSEHLVPLIWPWRSSTSLKHGCVCCPGSVFTVWNDFGSVLTLLRDVYPVSDPIASDLTWKVKWQATGHVCVRCQEILAVFCDHFGTRAECWHDFGSYPVPNSLTLKLAFKMILKIRFKTIFVLSAPYLIKVWRKCDFIPE